MVTLTGLPPPMSVGHAQCCPYYLVEAPRDWLDYIQFLSDPGLSIALSYPSVTQSLAVLIFSSNWICHSCYMDFFKLLHEFVKIGFIKFVVWMGMSKIGTLIQCLIYISMIYDMIIFTLRNG